MEALRFDPKTKELTFEKIPVPKIENDDDVIVEVAYCGICGTDLHILKVVHNLRLLPHCSLPPLRRGRRRKRDRHQARRWICPIFKSQIPRRVQTAGQYIIKTRSSDGAHFLHNLGPEQKLLAGTNRRQNSADGRRHHWQFMVGRSPSSWVQERHRGGAVRYAQRTEPAHGYLDYYKLGIEEFKMKDVQKALGVLEKATAAKAVFAINSNLE
ncbi:unnamed protein product [Nesidiocoris tenuis]|uniref:Uncharacterized protein n=1 Tax=Nesidiocoris tenuis TaxID=355587 RepID=A0A6H5H1V6_9HEMI|nr:unnamed protein product [Nesidiocoris tenuis]